MQSVVMSTAAPRAMSSVSRRGLASSKETSKGTFAMSHGMHQGRDRGHARQTGHEAGSGPPAAHDRHAGHSVAMFRDKFWLSFALTIPVVIWSPDVQHWLGYTAPAFPGSAFIPAILGTIVFSYGGLVFLRGARGELADRQPGMMTLISLAITVSFVTSLAATLGLFAIDILWELATLATIMLLGHWLEMRAIAQARGALDALAALLPDTVERVTDPGVEIVPLAAVRAGDLVLVRPGGPSSGRRRGCRGRRRCRRIDDHRRVPAGPEGARREGRCWHGRRWRQPAGPGHRGRRGHRPVRHHAPRRNRTDVRFSDAGARRPSGRGALLRGARCRRGHARLLVARRRCGARADPNGDRARNRLPARARAGDPARHRDLDVARRAERPSGQGPARARARPRAGRGDLRQDGPAHPWSARGLGRD